MFRNYESYIPEKFAQGKIEYLWGSRNAKDQRERIEEIFEQFPENAVKVFEYLKTPKILEYLAHMLSSFTKIQSFVIPVRTGRGIRRRIRFNDMDLDSLIKFAATVDEGERFHYYKRIGDVCLFLNGFFQNHTHSVLKIPGLVDGSKRMKRSYEDYETEGRRFYSLAEKHDTAARMELQTIFSSLKNNFTTAKKPLQFISLYYLNSKKFDLFGYQG